MFTEITEFLQPLDHNDRVDFVRYLNQSDRSILFSRKDVLLISELILKCTAGSPDASCPDNPARCYF